MNTILISAALMGLLVLFAYRMGLRDGRAMTQGRGLERIIRKRPRTDGTGRYSQILSNVERYDGTPKGQREIEK